MQQQAVSNTRMARRSEGELNWKLLVSMRIKSPFKYSDLHL